MNGRSTARARITGERRVRTIRTQKVSGGWLAFTRASTHPETYTFWRYEVIDSYGKVVLRDGSSVYAEVMEDAQSGVAAVRRLENAGHKVRRSFQELVDRCPE